MSTLAPDRPSIATDTAGTTVSERPGTRPGSSSGLDPAPERAAETTPGLTPGPTPGPTPDLAEAATAGPDEVLGQHVILELIDAGGLDDPALMERALREAVVAAGATLLHLHVHRFAPQGVSGVAVLAESHISAHTWPERAYGAFDIYTCGDCDPEAGAQALARAFGAGTVHMKILARGIFAARTR